MNLLFGFCLYMTFIYMPFDMFFKPVAEDQEVWFGFLLQGWAAKLTEPIHWAIYTAGAFGFWKMRAWMWPWAGLYAAQVALGMLVWSLLDSRGSLITGAIAMAVLLVPTVALLKAKARFDQQLSDPASIVEHESNVI
jgi:hypothetical protein